jgi:hypothetical protein
MLKKIKLLFWKIVPDRIHLQYKYWKVFHKLLDLKNPKSFNEKIQWLKLYDRNPKYALWVDKYEAKKKASEVIGEEYIIPTIMLWNTIDEIDFEKLPDEFVIKTTNGGGGDGVVICKSKKDFDKEKALKKLRQAYKLNLYNIQGEWPYSQFKPRIIAEKYLKDNTEENKGGLSDYKFYCFNGEVKFCMVCVGRSKGTPHFYFFTPEWKLLRINKRGKMAPEDFSLPKPEQIDKMFKIAADLSRGMPFVRTDLYYVNKQIFFGELTFYPDSGFDANYLPEADKWMGDLLNLPNKI